MMLIVTLLAVFSVAAADSPHKDPHYVPGHDTMVHLFEWKWNDIAKECEDFLGPMGYGGVQVSPIQENVIVAGRPWWERYQPISYFWTTRSGTKQEFADMVTRCTAAGVRIYVDIVANHMTGNHDSATGTGNSKADTYTRNYYAVPYSNKDFHRNCAISNYNDASNVRNCELEGLHDLNQGSEYVRGKIVDMMNEAIDLGVAGFRMDASKHMWPADLNVIYSRLKNLNIEHGFPPNARPFVFQEVIDYGNHEAVSKFEYNDIAVVTEFQHGAELSNSFRGNNFLKWFSNWGEKWNLLPSQDALVFIDNHDTQRSNSVNVLTYKSSKLYKMAVGFMLAQDYGIPRVMSSFDFNDFNQGPPMDSQERIVSPIIHPDNTCSGGWICEHRWRQIYNMVRFRNAANGTKVTNWWDNGSNQIVFCRGDAGFVAFNGDQYDMNITVKSCLPPGTYCDVVSGNMENGKCTGKVVTVQRDGNVRVEISKREDDGFLAIHRNAKVA
ncbi:alpha-amylase-like [Hylaeus volcanicus]|uniref:alpha-amylase-like n=1 Tax=Hylaeus volcanicus TaxID=313075 RepID=UPI0023B78571|nr:alpha-amylase-like [Hylaeus volcanicus]